MNWKKIGKIMLFPHLGFIIMFLPLSIALLVFSLVFYDTTSAISIVSYVLAFYMLVVLCLRLPKMIEFCKKMKNENKYILKLRKDVNLRINISLYGSLIWNGAFAILQLGLGFFHSSLWFYTMAVYYTLIALMRFFLLKHTRNFKSDENLDVQTKKYYICGWLLLVLNVILAGITTFIVYQNKAIAHHEITTIALATYTFTTFVYAIVSNVRYRKYNSPVYSASKCITLFLACVSMLTLESAMLATFEQPNSASFNQIMLSISSVAVCGFCIGLAIYMIVNGAKKIKSLKNNNNNLENNKK